MTDPFTLLQLADIYQKKAAETLDQSDLAHARRYRECAEEIVKLRQELSDMKAHYQAALEAEEIIRKQCVELTAHCEGLREALKYCRGYAEGHAEYCPAINGLIGDIDQFLTETPAQSIANLRASVRANVLREAAEFVGRNLYDCKTYEDELLIMADKEEQ